jgi:hypothetical protein
MPAAEIGVRARLQDAGIYRRSTMFFGRVRLRQNRNRRSNFDVPGFGRKMCQCQCQVVASCQLAVLSRKERDADNLLSSVTSMSSVRGSLRRHGWTLPRPQPNSVIGGICEILPRRIRGCGLFPRIRSRLRRSFALPTNR